MNRAVLTTPLELSSVCSLCALCVSVVNLLSDLVGSLPRRFGSLIPASPDQSLPESPCKQLESHKQKKAAAAYPVPQD